MNHDIRASVIVCVYNREEQIGFCLDSLLAMDARDFEIIAVDDGSTDATVEILDTYAGRCESLDRVSFRIVRNARNLGVSGARNAGIAVARGEFVAFTDSDCTVDPGWLAALLAGFDEASVVAVGGLVVDVPPRTYGELVYRGTCRIGRPGQGRFLVGCNMAFRREILERYRFDTAMSYYCDEDELSWRLGDDGLERRYTPDARVTHNHTMTLLSLLALSHRQGEGSARLWYKHDRWIGRDMLFWLAVIACGIAGFFHPFGWLLAGFFCLLLVAALFANELLFKRKSLGQALTSLPGVFLQGLWKLSGVLRTYGRVATGREPAIVRSKRLWRERAIAPKRT